MIWDHQKQFSTRTSFNQCNHSYIDHVFIFSTSKTHQGKGMGYHWMIGSINTYNREKLQQQNWLGRLIMEDHRFSNMTPSLKRVLQKLTMRTVGQNANERKSLRNSIFKVNWGRDYQVKKYSWITEWTGTFHFVPINCYVLYQALSNLYYKDVFMSDIGNTTHFESVGIFLFDIL